MKMLGIDLGLQRTGMALSDSTAVFIKHLPNLQAKNQQDAILFILQLCLDYDVGIVVIGRPKSITPQSQAIVKRAESLSNRLNDFFIEKEMNIKIFLFDESYTSKIAAKNLVMSDVSKKKRKKLLDSESAAVLLEEFSYWYKESGLA